MKKVILKSLAVISPAFQKAKLIEFDEHLTVFMSEFDDGSSINHTGKSLIMQSIYHALGAKLTKYTRSWKMLNAVTIIKFLYNQQEIKLFRSGDSFVFSNLSTLEINVFSTVEKLKDFYQSFFDINLQLLLKNEEEPNLHIPYPSALFLPFYIDQDSGWDGNWKSFSELQMYKDYRKEIFSFQTGIRNNRYYTLLLNKNRYQVAQSKFQKSKMDCDTTIAVNLEKFKDIMGVNIDINEFQEEINNLILMLNRVQKQKEDLKSKLLLVYNRRAELESTLNNISSILSDLQKDEKYINKTLQEEVILCPMCGAEHKNTITTRYMFKLDIEECNDKISNCRNQLSRCESSIKKLEEQISQLMQNESQITQILSKKKQKIELEDVLISCGINELIRKLSADSESLQMNIEENKAKLIEIDKQLKLFKKAEEDISALFNQYVNANVAMLSISDLDINEDKEIGSSLKGGGSDLAKMVLAYTIAYFKLITQNEDAVIFPLVLDTMLQQEQSTKSISDMFKLVVDNQPADSQLILATTNTYGVKFKGKIYTFYQQNAALNKDDYEAIKGEYTHFLSLLADVR